MSTLRSPSRGAVSYVVIALLAAAVGALGTWTLQGHGATRLDAVTTHGEWVYIKRGVDSIRAYVAYPERRDKAPGIIVIHEIFGLTDWEPTVADRLAKNDLGPLLDKAGKISQTRRAEGQKSDVAADKKRSADAEQQAVRPGYTNSGASLKPAAEPSSPPAPPREPGCEKRAPRPRSALPRADRTRWPSRPP